MKKEIYLILDNIRSRENVGSIFRTADAAGVKKIYICGITPVPPHPKITKASLGAETYVLWEYYKQAGKIIKELADKHMNIVALEQTRKSSDIFKFKPKFPLILILGNEIRGVRPQILKQCDNIINIPMRGKKESLNVSVAAGVALFRLVNIK